MTISLESLQAICAIVVAVITVGTFLFKFFKNRWKEPLSKLDTRVSLLEQKTERIDELKDDIERLSDRTESRLNALSDQLIKILSGGSIRLSRDRSNK